MTTTQPNVDVGKLNDFLTKASELLSCDETCQHNKKQLLLKEKYLKAKANYASAPGQIETSYKNYLTYTEGEAAYGEHHKKVLLEKARALAKTFASEFQEQIQTAKNLISTYDGLFLNFVHVVEYYNGLVKKNKLMTFNLNNKSSDIVTNDRKTFYEEQKIDSLYFYYRIILLIYVVVLISFAASILFKPADMGRKKQTAVLVVFIIYPFVAARLFLFLGSLYEKLANILPKNVYKNDEPTHSPNSRVLAVEAHERGCHASLFGCCDDGVTFKADEDGTNCPCGAYGCCEDGATKKTDEAGTNCDEYAIPIVIE